MDRTSTQSVSIETIREAIRPVIRQEVERAILQALDRHADEYPPESAIRKSFIKRVEKNRQELAPEIYNIQMLAQL